jgi:chemotaxis protein MotB
MPAAPAHAAGADGRHEPRARASTSSTTPILDVRASAPRATPDARTLLAAIAQTVAPEAGLVTIRGHTDALPWKSGVQANNWSLSAGRAEATRQQLMRDGIGERRFRRIEGVADRELLIADHPEDPRNRRMSILLTR